MSERKDYDSKVFLLIPNIRTFEKGALVYERGTSVFHIRVGYLIGEDTTLYFIDEDERDRILNKIKERYVAFIEQNKG